MIEGVPLFYSDFIALSAERKPGASSPSCITCTPGQSVQFQRVFIRRTTSMLSVLLEEEEAILHRASRA